MRRRIASLHRSLFPNSLPRRGAVTTIATGIIAVALLGGVTLIPSRGDPQTNVSSGSDRSAELISPNTESRTKPNFLTAQNEPQIVQVRGESATENGTPQAGVDVYGDPLPQGAVSRLGTVRYRHGGSDKQIEFLPGETTFAVGAFQSTVRLWDALSGRMVREIDIGDDYLHAFRASADGRAIVTLSRTSDFDQTERIYHMRLVVWDAKSGIELRPILWDEPFRSRAMQLALSPDGKTAAVATHDGEVRIWDLPWGEERHRRKLVPDEVDCLEFSPDGKLIAAASTRAVVLWRFGSDEQPQKLDGLRRGGQVVRFSPDGAILAVAAGDDKAAHLYDVATRKPLRQLSGAGGRYSGPQFCFADGGQKLIVPRSRSPIVEIFDTRTGRVVRTLDSGGQGTGALALSSEGRFLAGANGAAIVVWNLTTGERISDRFIGHDIEPTELVFRPDDRHVVTGGQDGTIRIWDAQTGRQLRLLTHDRWVAGLAISPDGKWLASCGLDDTVRLWDFATGEQRNKLPGHGLSGGSHNTQVAFSADGQRFYSFGMDFILRAYSAETGRILAEHAIRPSGLQFEESGDGQLRLGGGGEREAMQMSMLMAMSQAAWSADAARFFLSTQTDNAIHVFDTRTGEETGVIKPTDRYRKFSVSPQDDRVATVEQLANPNADPHDRGSRRYVLRLHDVATKKLINEVPLEGAFGYQVALSPDGNLIAASQSDLNWTPNADRWVDVWEVEALKRVARVAGGSPAVRGITFSHDARRLATSHEDSTVIVWDLQALRGE